MPSPNHAATSEVLKIYTLAVKTSLNEHQAAFDGAVGAYRHFVARIGRRK